MAAILETKPLEDAIKHVDSGALTAFEHGLDPAHPERSELPPRILGYGEISTVFEIPTPEAQGLAFKRLAIFRTSQEIDTYQKLHGEYCELLQTSAGLSLPVHASVRVSGRIGRPMLYLIQGKLPAGTLAHRSLDLPVDRLQAALAQILEEILKVIDFNRRDPSLALGLDGQLSNWSLDPSYRIAGEMRAVTPPCYLDTSTPLLRREGVEQLDPELFLRTAPSFLAWILRWLFLDEVLERYYHARDIFVDLIANLYKEHRPDLIPDAVRLANVYLGRRGEIPIEAEEVRSYYARDALIWSLFLRMRRLDRWLNRLVGRPYEYILPERISR